MVLFGVSLALAIACAALAAGLVQRRSVAERLASLEALVDGAALRSEEAVAPLRIEDVQAPRAERAGVGLGGSPSVRLSRLTSLIKDELARAEEAAELSDRLVGAIGAMSYGVIVVDEDRTPVLANAAGRRYMGARHGLALVGAAAVESLGVALEQGLTERDVEVHGPPHRWFRVIARRVDGARSAAGAVAVVVDVTDRVKVDRLRRDFVANVSHERKTPVGALASLAEVAAETDGSTREELLGRLEGEARRMVSIIDHMLELAKVEAGAGLAGQEIEVDSVIDRVVRELGGLAGERGVGVDLGPRSEATVFGATHDLTFALKNLVENAISYSTPGDRVRILAEEDVGQVVIRVIDQGVGIPSADLDRVFERLYRVDRSRSRDNGGAGLGLSIVRHAAENLGGQVRVTSRQGVGSTFTLSIPSAVAGQARLAERVEV